MKRKAQTSLEYMTLVVIVIGAALTMAAYFKRGIQGRWRTSVDNLGDQYDPLLMNTDITQARSQRTETTILSVPGTDVGFTGYWTIRRDETNMTDFKWGYERAGAY